MAIWSKLTAAIAAFGAGGAASAAAGPAFEVPRQSGWKKAPNRILDLGTLAHLVAQGLIDESLVVDEAKRNGYNENRLKARIQVELHAPDVSEVLELWRRNATRPADEQISDEQVDHALAKAGIEAQYWPAIKELFHERLSVQDVAVMVQRGILPNPGWLPVGPPSEVGRVPPMPQAPLDPVAEAQSQGFDSDRAAALAKIIGLPASPDLAARMVFRDIIERVDFDRAISEGNTRNEWAPFLFEGFRQIVTAHDGVELHLRGWTDEAGMYEQTARHGMSEADTDILFKITGRPLSFHQAFIGHRRGGELDGSTADIPEYFLRSLQESNIRPEWYALAWSQRFSYPSAFVLRALTEAGDLTQKETEDILLFEGWEPTLAAKVSTRWADTVKATPTNKQVASAQTKLITATHKAYIGDVIQDAAATAQLEGAGLTPEIAGQVLYYWSQEKQLENLPPAAA